MRAVLVLLLLLTLSQGVVLFPEEWISTLDGLKQRLSRSPDDDRVPELLQQHFETPPLPPNTDATLESAAIWRRWASLDPLSFLPHCGAAICESTINTTQSHMAASDHFAACFGLGARTVDLPSGHLPSIKLHGAQRDGYPTAGWR